MLWLALVQFVSQLHYHHSTLTSEIRSWTWRSLGSPVKRYTAVWENSLHGKFLAWNSAYHISKAALQVCRQIFRVFQNVTKQFVSMKVSFTVVPCNWLSTGVSLWNGSQHLVSINMDEFLDQLIDDQLPKKDWHSYSPKVQHLFHEEERRIN